MAMPVISENGLDTPSVIASSQTPPQTRTIISFGFSGSCAKAGRRPVNPTTSAAAAPCSTRRRVTGMIDFVLRDLAHGASSPLLFLRRV